MKTHAQTSKSKSSITKQAVTKRATSQFKAKPDLHISAMQKIANGSSGAVAQKAAAEEEELMQGKFKTAQLFGGLEEEELQGKFKTIQKQPEEEEELMQGKFKTTQFVSVPEEEELQGKFKTIQKQDLDDEELMQGKFTAASATVQKQESAAPKNNNTGLPDNLKSGIENLSGYSMDDVKVHYNSLKPADLHAHAFAQGTDIHLNSGQEKHLPHEAWHVVQQKQGRVKPTLQMKGGVNVNDDKGLENEADVMGAKAVQMKKNINTPNETDSKSLNITAQPVTQRIPISNKGMRDSGFDYYKGSEWIWYNQKGKQPNHVSAIREDGNVHHIHAKTQFSKKKTNRIDWDEKDGNFDGPKTKYKQSPKNWDSWFPDANEAGKITISYLKQNEKK